MLSIQEIWTSEESNAEQGYLTHGAFDMERPESGVPGIRNLRHWFSPQTAQHLVVLKAWVKAVAEPELRNVAMVAFLSSIRAASNASSRTGRLFLDKDKTLQNPY